VLSITAKSPYALSALVELALSPEGRPVPVAELARKRGVPSQFLEQICATLRRGGMLRSQRGVKGGFLLALDPAQITALEVVELLDGKLGAGSEGVLQEASDAARAVLEGVTIADLAERESRKESPMYYI
jgi:Rrf2 family protein